MRRLYQTIACLFAIPLLFLGPGAWGCSQVDEFLHPRCTPEQLQYGICVNPRLDEALRLVRSAAYQERLSHIAAQAEKYLDQIEPGPDKVVITDLDETLLDNLAYYQRYGAFQPEFWQAWVESRTGPGPYYQNVRQLVLKAKARGFSVMFITGRPTPQAAATLTQVGDIQWDGIFFKPQGIRLTSARYKAAVRQMLKDLGYTIVLNIGDQLSDLDPPVEPEQGEFLLPNVLYSIP